MTTNEMMNEILEFAKDYKGSGNGIAYDYFTSLSVGVVIELENNLSRNNTFVRGNSFQGVYESIDAVVENMSNLGMIN